MNSARFLLPFTQNLDLGALAYAVQFAKGYQATLIPFALLPLSEHQWAEGPRLEMIEQANDFLEAVKFQAAQTGVAIEPCEISTRDVVQSISFFAQEMMCQGILLFLPSGTTALLSPEVVKRLLEQVPCTLYLVRLHSADKTGPVQTLLKWCSDRIHSWQEGREEVQQFQEYAVPIGEMITLSNRDTAIHTKKEEKKETQSNEHDTR